MEGSHGSTEQDSAGPLTPLTRGIIQHFEFLLNGHGKNIHQALDQVNDNLMTLRTCLSTLSKDGQLWPMMTQGWKTLLFIGIWVGYDNNNSKILPRKPGSLVRR